MGANYTFIGGGAHADAYLIHTYRPEHRLTDNTGCMQCAETDNYVHLDLIFLFFFLFGLVTHNERGEEDERNKICHSEVYTTLILVPVACVLIAWPSVHTRLHDLLPVFTRCTPIDCICRSC